MFQVNIFKRFLRMINIRRVLIAVFAIILLVSVILLIRANQIYAQATSTYNGIRSEFKRNYLSSVSNVQTKDLVGTDKINQSEMAVEILEDPYLDNTIDWDNLLAVNPDIIAWITYPEANIDYPILKSNDKEEPLYYMHNTAYKEENSAGSIFILDGQDEDFSDLNTFVYGHNMRNKSMFGTLKVLFNTKTMEDPYFYIYLPSGDVYKYFVYASCVTDYSDTELYTIPDDTTYSEYVDTVRTKARESGSWYPDVDDINMDEKTVTLSTCYGNRGTDKRLLFFGMKTN